MSRRMDNGAPQRAQDERSSTNAAEGLPPSEPPDAIPQNSFVGPGSGFTTKGNAVRTLGAGRFSKYVGNDKFKQSKNGTSVSSNDEEPGTTQIEFDEGAIRSSLQYVNEEQRKVKDRNPSDGSNDDAGPAVRRAKNLGAAAAFSESTTTAGDGNTTTATDSTTPTTMSSGMSNNSQSEQSSADSSSKGSVDSSAFDIPRDEEDTEDYKHGGYHPVKIGEVFNERYEVVRKLGWGQFSTVWLAKDLTATYKYVSLKVVRSAPHYRDTAIDEIKLLERINEGTKSHLGRKHVVSMLDHFVHTGPNGQHNCIVMEVLGENLLSLMRRYNHQGVPVPLVKQITKQIMLGIDYLHRECGIIHTDLKPENVLIEVDTDRLAEVLKKEALEKDKCKKRKEVNGDRDDSSNSNGSKTDSINSKSSNGSKNSATAGSESSKRSKSDKKRKGKASRKDTGKHTNGKNTNGKNTNGKDTNGKDANGKDANGEGTCVVGSQPLPYILRVGHKDEKTEIQTYPARASESASDNVETNGDAAKLHARMFNRRKGLESGTSIQTDKDNQNEDEEDQGEEVEEEDLNLSPSSSVRTDDEVSSRDEASIHENQDENQGQTPQEIDPRGDCLEQLVTEDMVKALDDEMISVKIADLGNACWVDHHFTNDVQTRQYRAPEVLLGCKWGAGIDTWSLGCLIFELITSDYLFEPAIGQHYSKDDDHIAQIVELLGKMPMSMVLSGQYSAQYFTHDGHLRKIHTLREWGLKSVFTDKYSMGDEEASRLCQLLLPLLALHPEQRADAGGMLDVEWLKDARNLENVSVGRKPDFKGKGIRGWSSQE